MTLSNDYFINLSIEIYLNILNLQRKSIGNEVILNKMLKDSTLTYLLENFNIRYIEKKRKQTQRLLEVISFTLLKSSSYHELIEDLMQYTKKTIGSIRASIKKNLKTFSKATGLNITKWQPEKIYGIEKYTEDDVKWWKGLYEEVGSYNSVKEHIRKVMGDGPTDTTIKERLYRFFNKEGKDFEIWERNFKRNIKIQKYGEKEVGYWINLYEEIGSFKGVSDYTYNNYGKLTSGSNIKKRIRKKFIRESRNFDEWEAKFRADNPTTFKPIYTEEEVKEWIRLFEKYGVFNKISNFIKKKYNKTGPDAAVIKYRIQKRFERENRDFNKWFKKYNVESTGQFVKKFSREDVEEWERLYEELGSFNSVVNYLDMFNNYTIPSHHTIIRRLKEKFERKGRDFKKWVIEFFSSNHGRAYNIGKFTHNILEWIFIEFCLEKGLKGFYEISPTFEKETIIDNALIDIYSNIKMINIDYTTSRFIPNITKKFYKKYQSIERILLIVLLIENVKFKIPKNLKIPYKHNIKLLNGDEFAKYMGYDGKYLKIYEKVKDLLKIALYDDYAYKELERVSKKALIELIKLSKEYPITQQDLIKFLNHKNLLHILRDLRFKELNTF